MPCDCTWTAYCITLTPNSQFKNSGDGRQTNALWLHMDSILHNTNSKLPI